MVASNACQPYPIYCTNVDLYGNCISCTFASQLSNGQCVGTTLRNLNCDTFDSINLICLQCSVGYNYCSITAICVIINQNCQTWFGSTCTQCVSGFLMIDGDCIRSPPGMIIQSNNSIICDTGYYYSSASQFGQGVNGACFRNKSQLIKASTMGSEIQFLGTLYQPGQNSLGNPTSQYNQMWNPPSYLNNYISIVSTTVQIIFTIEVTGCSSGHVTYFQLQFRNKVESPFICWNSCQKVPGNVDGSNVVTLNLDQPIIAT